MTAEHPVHTDHQHIHGPGCGHASVEREDHTDYVHEGHAHTPHEDHYDEHPLPHLAHAGHDARPRARLRARGRSPTATTSTTRTTATATPPTTATTTSTNSTGPQPGPAGSQRSDMPAQGMADDMHSVAERRLRRIDQRYTAGRRAIIELLLSAGHPVSIEDIAEHLPGVPRSSAYRHLTNLQAAGLVRGSPPTTNSPASSWPKTSPSTTTTCYASTAARSPTSPSPPTSNSKSPAPSTKLADAEGFQAHSHRLDVLGLCAACQ